ncbi:hypothetical protein FNH09_20225 [Streptomyces adustus]|uniref:Uncharacterized protein n=1 Tax=Streptomyces adustus TaxID=1609272 RepID=A0A5N8VHN4_9ACTN|nr:hypothetical protein [Streptomyces adustus]MPY33495.1 hypothetical protein [Streptomyces adustus]
MRHADGAPDVSTGGRQGTQAFPQIGHVFSGSGGEQAVQSLQSGAGGGAQAAGRYPVEYVQGALRSIGWLVAGFGLGQDKSGSGPSGGAGGAGGRGGLGAGAGLFGAAQREVRFGLMQGEFGFVEAETTGCLAGRVGFEFGQGHLECGVRLPVAALPGEGGQQRPGVELGMDQAGGGRGRAALGVRVRGVQVAGVAGDHALRPVRPRRQRCVTAPVGVGDGGAQVEPCAGRVVEAEGQVAQQS